MTTLDIAFVGLGVMGYPMAGHLATAGHTLTVYNRTTSKAEAWVDEHKGSVAATPRIAAVDKDIVFMCVGNDDDVRSVVYGGDGIAVGMEHGMGVLIDHTTVSATIAHELHALGKERGFQFLDAPVSGGQAGAENGVLTIMVGGEQPIFENVLSVMRVYGRAVTLMGPPGAGQLTKMANQICIAGLMEGLSEGVNFAVRAGLDGKQVVDVISKGAAGSWQMENRGETMVDDEFEFGFAVDWMCKDLDIALAEGHDD